MMRLVQLILVVGAVVACGNPVGPSEKFMGDPPIRIDPAPIHSGFQVNPAQASHP
ncbi:MAG TPA: hypothetical protein VJ865_01855 [Gemmatimonadaceae bacterium]|nr:hypothetical protein [Gemmatimonadaceae bacterium]